MKSDAFRSEPTLAAVEQQWKDDGWEDEFLVRPGGKVLCKRCDREIPASELEVDRIKRLEGASAAKDERLLVAAHQGEGDDACRGTLVIGYGPAAGREAVQVLEDLDVEGAEET